MTVFLGVALRRAPSLCAAQCGTATETSVPVVRLVVRRFRVERAIDGELDERSVFWNQRLHCCERDGLRALVEARTPVADLNFEILSLLLQPFDLLLILGWRRLLRRPIKNELREFRGGVA